MKKWLAALLAALMVLACACAVAEDFKVTDEVAFAVTDEHDDRALIYVAIEVENVAGKPLSLGYQSSFTVVDQNGKEYSEGTFMSMYPQSIAPGEKGYILPSTYSLTELKSYEQVADYHYELVGGDPSYFTCDKYETSIEEHDGRIMIKLTNPTGEPMYDPSLVMIYRGSEGQLLHVETNYLYDYGIPAGMSAYVDMTPRKEVRDFFSDNGYTLEATESFAYVTNYKY